MEIFIPNLNKLIPQNSNATVYFVQKGRSQKDDIAYLDS